MAWAEAVAEAGATVVVGSTEVRPLRATKAAPIALAARLTTIAPAVPRNLKFQSVPLDNCSVE